MSKPANSGRKKGTLDSRQRLAKEACDKHGVDVFEFMAMVVADKYEELGQKKTLSMDLRVKTACDLAKYVAPQLKSIEGKVEHKVDVIGELLKGLDQGTPLVLQEGKPLPDVVVITTKDTKRESLKSDSDAEFNDNSKLNSSRSV